MERLPHSGYWVVLLALLVNSGCTHWGPGIIKDDRVQYNEAIVTSWKEQTLLNLVRLRYNDIPGFIDIPSVVNGFEHAQNVSGNISSTLFPAAYKGDLLTFGLGGSQTMSDKPTITYVPQTTSEFVRHLYRPIPTMQILGLIEGGLPADLVLELAVESINGIRNSQTFGGRLQAADPRFQQVIRTMEKLHDAGYLHLHIKPGKDKENPDIVMTIDDRNIPPALARERAQMRQELHLAAGGREFKIVHETLPRAKDEIAFRSRSVMRIMTYLSLHVQVPIEHIAEGLARDLGEPNPEITPHLMVYSGPKKPCKYFAAVYYKCNWFWIDDRDYRSKRTIQYLRVLLAFADTEKKGGLGPVLTVQAN